MSESPLARFKATQAPEELRAAQKAEVDRLSAMQRESRPFIDALIEEVFSADNSYLADFDFFEGPPVDRPLRLIAQAGEDDCQVEKAPRDVLSIEPEDSDA